MTSPRYLAAHMVLPAFLREQPASLVHEAIARGDTEFLIPVWIRAGIRFTPRMIDLSRGEYRVGVLTLPMPREMSEAYLAAVVSRGGDPSSLRYFLLELGTSSSDNSPRTVIGEWAGSTHSNFGSGPPVTGNLSADCEAFVERVLQFC